jgi:hypothetical protein
MEAQERLTNCVGPRGIQTLVETRRREGLMLPFRVTIKRHSRLALVTYWDEDMDRTEEVRACCLFALLAAICTCHPAGIVWRTAVT